MKKNFLFIISMIVFVIGLAFGAAQTLGTHPNLEQQDRDHAAAIKDMGSKLDDHMGATTRGISGLSERLSAVEIGLQWNQRIGVAIFLMLVGNAGVALHTANRVRRHMPRKEVVIDGTT